MGRSGLASATLPFAEEGKAIKFIIVKGNKLMRANHGTASGVANIQNGITLDLKRLNGVAISNDRKCATYEHGSRWNDVYKPLTALALQLLAAELPMSASVGWCLEVSCSA